MANIVRDDEVVEELHRGFPAAPNLHLHLDKYVMERGNSVSEYHRAVTRLQDSARRDGHLLPQPRIGTRCPPFRESTGNWSSNTTQPHMPATRNAVGTAATGAAATGTAAKGATATNALARVAPRTSR
jgi:hypothetical protein